MQKLLYQLNRDPEVRKRYDSDRDALLAGYTLTDEELTAIRAGDIGLLYVMGVNGGAPRRVSTSGTYNTSPN